MCVHEYTRRWTKRIDAMTAWRHQPRWNFKSLKNQDWYKHFSCFELTVYTNSNKSEAVTVQETGVCIFCQYNTHSRSWVAYAVTTVTECGVKYGGNKIKDGDGAMKLTHHNTMTLQCNANAFLFAQLTREYIPRFVMV